MAGGTVEARSPHHAPGRRQGWVRVVRYLALAPVSAPPRQDRTGTQPGRPGETLASQPRRRPSAAVGAQTMKPPIEAGQIDRIHAHMRAGGRVLVKSHWRPLILTAPEQISADGTGYRVPAGPRTRRTA